MPAAGGWVLNACPVVDAALLIPAGGLADAHGRKRGFRDRSHLAPGRIGALAAAVGPNQGSSVVGRIGWPWAFPINVPMGAVALAIVESGSPDWQ